MARVKNMVELMDIKPLNPTIELRIERAKATEFIVNHTKIATIISYYDGLINEAIMVYENGHVVTNYDVFTVNELYHRIDMARGINAIVRRGKIIDNYVIRDNNGPVVIAQKLTFKIRDVKYYAIRVIINNVNAKGELISGKMVILTSIRKIRIPFRGLDTDKLMEYVKRWIWNRINP